MNFINCTGKNLDIPFRFGYNDITDADKRVRKTASRKSEKLNI